MAKDKDTDASHTAGQSKRPAITQHDSDSQLSDNVQQQQQQHVEPHSRQKHHKHPVGGAGGRVHARVPSSKSLHKHHSATASAKQHRPRTSSPDRAAQLASLTSHRRGASETKISRDSSSSNLKKNSSQSSLKRNRSQVDVGKRSKSSTQLKRTFSNPNVNKPKSSKNQVHFDLGTDDQDEGQDEEWVDASTSASPYLSRRGSVVSSVHSLSKQADGPDSPASDRPANGRESPKSSKPSDRETVQRKAYLTTRLLQRSPSSGAPPKMSSETASVRASGGHRIQADPILGRENTLSGTPEVMSHTMTGSSGKEAMTSRFVRNSHGSGITGEGSFYQAPARGPAMLADESHAPGPRRPRSMGALAHTNLVSSSLPIDEDAPNDDLSCMTDDEAGGSGSRLPRDRRNARRTSGYAAAPAEFSRTQQKLNLERASSSLEPNHRNRQGPVSGALLGGAGYDTRDPRVGKLLERTGMEYLVVRRYQNPVARSLARLAQLPGAGDGRRIPTKPNGGTPSRGGHAKRASEYGGGRFGLSQSFRERDTRNIHSSGGPSSSTCGEALRRPFSSIQSNGAGSSADTEGESSRLHEGLSGSSLVDGEDDDGTVALLRNLWEKNLDLSASQD